MTDFDTAYADLRARMLRAAPAMKVATDAPGNLVLHAPWPDPQKPKDPVWFGAIQIKKAYVSYHLMAAYAHPDLLDHASEPLKKRMQGKTCFNFKAPDPALFDELEALTARGAALYAEPFTPRPHG